MKHHVTSAVVAAIVALGIGYLPKPAGEHKNVPETATISQKNSVYDRVIKSQTIRCGYGSWEPYFMKDPNTGAYSGIFYEYMNALGKDLGLKIEWTEETDWTSFGAALNSGRIDAFCIGIWPTGQRARQVDFTIPIFYSAINAYVRADNTRFDGRLSAIDDTNVKIATLDGEMSNAIAAADFPKAKVLASPQLIGQTALMQNVASGKADITFTDPATAGEFMKNNPGIMKILPGSENIRVFGNPIAIKTDEYRLKAMLDTGTQELLQSGVIEKIIRKYEKIPGSFPRVAQPYEQTK